MRPESAQDQHDEMLTSRKPKLLPKAEFEALLKERSAASSQPVSSTAFDPIEVAIQDNPGLTREKAEYDYASQTRTRRSAELLAQRPEIIRLREETDCRVRNSGC